MEFNKTIAARQSVRKFTEAQITDEQLKAILEAANAAPACMGQYDHLHLTVVQKPEILAQINAAFRKAVNDPNIQVTYGAPTVIYVSCKNEDEEIIKGCNAGVVMENMLLEAADLGLGAVYLFGVSQVLFANEEITKLLQIPEGFRTVSAIAVGTSGCPSGKNTGYRQNQHNNAVKYILNWHNNPVNTYTESGVLSDREALCADF